VTRLPKDPTGVQNKDFMVGEDKALGAQISPSEIINPCPAVRCVCVCLGVSVCVLGSGFILFI